MEKRGGGERERERRRRRRKTIPQSYHMTLKERRLRNPTHVLNTSM